MREILFRGKRLDNGEWVEGSLHIEWGETRKDGSRNKDYRILGMRGECYYVDPDTVGQYTGLCDKSDKNGKKIFEGDIVKTQPFSDRPYSKKAKFKQHIGVVEYRIHPKYVSEWSVKIEDYDGFGCCNWSAFYDCEVIGNIHDNPELLKGE